MGKLRKAIISRAGEAPAYWQIGNLWQMMATGVQTENAFTMIDQVVAARPGGGPLTHSHEQDEGMYVLSGKCTFNAGGQHGLQGTPGTFVCIPGHTEHSFTVDERDTHLLNFYLPAGFEQSLLGLSHPASGHVPPPEDKIPEMLPPRWLADKLSDDYGTLNILGQPWCDVPDPGKMVTKPTPGGTLTPFASKASALPTLHAMGGRWTILASCEQTGGAYSMLEVQYSQGPVFEPRLYEHDEMIYIISGTMSVLVGDRFDNVGPGDMVYVPSGVVYSARVDSNNGARFLDLHIKGGFEKLLHASSNDLTARFFEPVKDYRGEQTESPYKKLLRKTGLQYISVPSPWSDVTR